VNILIIPSWYPSDDNPIAGIFIHQQAKALKKEGHDVVVLAITQARYPKPLYEELYEGVQVFRQEIGFEAEGRSFLKKKIDGVKYRKMWLTGMRDDYCAAYENICKQRFIPDIIHVHALWPAGLGAAQISKKYKIPFVITEHSEEYARDSKRKLIRTPGMLPLVLRPVAHKASAYIAVSHAFARRLEELGLADSVKVVPNVVPDRESVEPYPEVSGRISFVHVSQAGPAKNLEMLLDAVKVLSKKRSDFLLTIAGVGESTDALIEKAKQTGLFETYVKFLGKVDPSGVNDLLDKYMFGVISSKSETFSVFAAECLMAGRPVLSTRCGGPEDFLNAKVGHLVANNDSRAMAAGMDWMLDHYREFDPQELNAFAREHFSPEIVCEQLIKIYEGVLSDGE